MRRLNGWNSLRLHIVTGRSIREEAVTPSYDLVGKLRTRRLKWVGHILRQDEGTLLREVLLARCREFLNAGGYPEGFLLMDAPTHNSAEDLVALAQDKEAWMVATISITLA